MMREWKIRNGFRETTPLWACVRAHAWIVANYNSLEEECLTSEKWSPLAEMWAERAWKE